MLEIDIAVCCIMNEMMEYICCWEIYIVFIWLRQPCFARWTTVNRSWRHLISDLFPTLFLAKTSFIKYILLRYWMVKTAIETFISISDLVKKHTRHVVFIDIDAEMNCGMCSAAFLRCVWPNRCTYNIFFCENVYQMPKWQNVPKHFNFISGRNEWHV